MERSKRKNEFCTVPIGIELKVEIMLPFITFTNDIDSVAVWSATAIILANQVAEARYRTCETAYAKALVLFVSAVAALLITLVLVGRNSGIATLLRGDLLEDRYTLHPYLKLWLMLASAIFCLRGLAMFLSWFLGRPKSAPSSE